MALLQTARVSAMCLVTADLQAHVSGQRADTWGYKYAVLGVLNRI